MKTVNFAEGKWQQNELQKAYSFRFTETRSKSLWAGAFPSSEACLKVISSRTTILPRAAL